VKRSIIWEQMVDRIKEAVGLQSERGDEGLRATFKTSEDDSFQVKTLLFPIARVDVAFEDKRLVRITFSYQKSDLADVRTWKDYLEFKTDANDNVQMYHRGEPISVDDAALLILRPVRRDPTFSPPPALP
jgi:hypothetical protein